MGVRVHSNTYLLRVGIVLLMLMAVLSKAKDEHKDKNNDVQRIEESTGNIPEETEEN